MSRKKGQEVIEKLRVRRGELDAALKKLRPIVKGGGAIQALRSCRLSVLARPDGLRLAIEATNLRECLALDIEALEGREGPLAVIDFERLAAFAASDWGEEVDIWVEEGRLVCKGKTTSRIVISDEDSYPILSTAPEKGEWLEGLHRDLVEELLVARKFSKGEGGAVNELLFLVEEEGALRIWAAAESVAWWRRYGVVVAEGWRLELTHGLVGMLAAVVENGKPFEILRTEHHDFFRGEGYALAQRRPEGAEWDPRGLVKGKNFSDGEDVALPALINLIPTFEGVVSAGEQGDGGKARRFPLVIEATGEAGRRKVSIYSDLVSGEGEIEADFPEFRTGRPDQLIGALKALDKLAGPDERVTAADVHGDGSILRFSLDGRALAWISAMRS